MRARTGMLLFTITVFTAVVIVNLLSINHHKKFDLTAQGAYSLSGQTRKILDSLEENITVYAFVRSDKQQEATDILELYDYASEKFSYKIVDPDMNPVMAKKYNITDYETYLVETQSGKKQNIKTLDENNLTNAIIKAVTTKEKIIYALQGHGERSLDEKKPRAWSGAKSALAQAAYKIKTLNWFNAGASPDDIDLLLIAGPKKDLQPVEIKKLKQLSDRGVSIFITIDPEYLPNLQKFLGDYGFRFNEDIIVDPVSQQLGFKWLLATVSRYGKHPIVKQVKAATFFWVARSIEFVFDNKMKTKLSAVGSTASQSWGETDLKSVENGKPEFNKGKDMAGPRIVLATAEWEIGLARENRRIGEPPRKARMAVAGDSDFAANSYLALSANKDVFLNTTGWLLEQENRLSIRAATRGFNPIMFTSGQLQLIFAGSVIALPAIVLLIGTLVWIRRRRD